MYARFLCHPHTLKIICWIQGIFMNVINYMTKVGASALHHLFSAFNVFKTIQQQQKISSLIIISVTKWKETVLDPLLITTYVYITRKYLLCIISICQRLCHWIIIYLKFNLIFSFHLVLVFIVVKILEKLLDDFFCRYL